MSDVDNYSENIFGHLENDVDKNQKKINAGLAGAIASAAIPHKFDYKTNIGVGVGSYRDQQAVAIGVKYNFLKNTIIGSNLSFDTQSGIGTSVGITYGF